MARGKEFTGRLFGLRKRAATGAQAFEQLCADLGIEHRLTPPASPRTNGMVERFNGRIEEVLQSHHFRSGEELETTLHRSVRLTNQQLPQLALGSKSPLQAMKDWHKLKPPRFRKQPYDLPGCDTPADPAVVERLVRAILSRRILPHQAIALYVNYPAQHPPVIDPRLAPRSRKERLQPLHLCFRQPETLAHDPSP
jgi:hypothetical protein